MAFSKTFCWRRWMSDVRVRFAPSPTGMLHLGGMRTALYNYLFARSHNGRFILRIEDTDRTRVVPYAMKKMVYMLDWIGIAPDEGPLQGGEYGPYMQSQRKAIYQEKIQELLMKSKAYYCFCTERRLDLLRKDLLKRRETFKYDNRCRSLSPGQVQEKLDAGIERVVRLKLEHHTEPWVDLIMGPIVNNVAETEGDPILMKSDNFPTYHFANVVDDHLMKVSHVLRGQEWQTSTTKHILLYKAFGWTPPRFGHLPLIVNKDGSKLSKRQEDIGVERYMDRGYLPDALINFVTYLGGGFNVKSTAGLKLNELVNEFDISRLRVNSGKLEMEKVDDFNRLHLKRQLQENEDSLIDTVSLMVEAKEYSWSIKDIILHNQYMKKVLTWSLDRISVLEDLLEPEFQYLWVMPHNIHLEQFTNLGHDSRTVINSTIQYLTKLEQSDFQQEKIADLMNKFVKNNGLKYGPYMTMLRKILGGLNVGPSIAEMISVLGKGNTINRLKYSLM